MFLFCIRLLISRSISFICLRISADVRSFGSAVGRAAVCVGGTALGFIGNLVVSMDVGGGGVELVVGGGDVEEEAAIASDATSDGDGGSGGGGGEGGGSLDRLSSASAPSEAAVGEREGASGGVGGAESRACAAALVDGDGSRTCARAS